MRGSVNMSASNTLQSEPIFSCIDFRAREVLVRLGPIMETLPSLNGRWEYVKPLVVDSKLFHDVSFWQQLSCKSSKTQPQTPGSRSCRTEMIQDLDCQLLIIS